MRADMRWVLFLMLHCAAEAIACFAERVRPKGPPPERWDEKPRPPLNLTRPDGEEDRPQQMEMRWV